MFDSVRNIALVTDWVPEPELRGNSRAHMYAKAGHAAELNDLGWFYGMELKQQQPYLQTPLRGILEIEIWCWTKRDIVDGDNMQIGYKHFIDGLQEWRRNRGVKLPGAHLITNDSQIKHWHIHMLKGAPASIIEIRETDVASYPEKAHPAL